MKLTLNNKLKELRENRELTQKDIASILNLNLTDRVSRWENGKAMPSIVSLFKLCHLYKKSCEEIYEDLFMEVGRIMNETAKEKINKRID